MYRTYQEYLRHPVFRAARLIAMRRNPLCDCGNPATEVHHHNGYPPWGMFDVPANLKPICHECHCREHGKHD
jgi:hypothetical protein